MAGAYVYLGRYFDGSSANQGDWVQPNGYRTMIHEFGHYGLGLFDSYFYYQTVPTGTVKTNSNCTSAAIRTNATAATNATLMDFQFNGSELAMRDITGLWSAQCLNTHQWQIHTKSDWETIADSFLDQDPSLRWWIKTPASHGGVVAGPTAIPVNAWTWTEVGNKAAVSCRGRKYHPFDDRPTRIEHPKGTIRVDLLFLRRMWFFGQHRPTARCG